MPQELVDIIFLGWLPIGLALPLIPYLLIGKGHWLSAKRFTSQYPQFAHLDRWISLMPIIWVTFSILLIGIQMEGYETSVFLTFFILVPLLGFGIFKGLIEMVWGVSYHRRLKIDRKRPRFRILVIQRTNRIPPTEYHYLYNPESVRRSGAMRIILNSAYIIAMTAFLL